MRKKANTIIFIAVTFGIGYIIYNQYLKNKNAGGNILYEQQVYNKQLRNIIIK